MSIDKIREAFPRFDWKQYGSFAVARTEYWILSVDVSLTEREHLASFSETTNLLRLPPAASYKTCAIEAVKDVLQQVQQSIKTKVDQLNKMSEEFKMKPTQDVRGVQMKPTLLKLPELGHYDPDWIPTLLEVRKNLQGRMQRYVCNAFPRRTVEEARTAGEILFYITESLEGDSTLITYLQRRGYPYIENEYATDLRVMWIEDTIYFCELAKKG